MQYLIQKVYSETSAELNNIYNQRKSARFFQKLMWTITGLYLIFLLVNMAVSFFPNAENDVLLLFKTFQSSPSQPYASIYPYAGLIILLYPTTYHFTHKFQQLKIQESVTISKMVKMLFPNVDFTQNTKSPTKEVVKSKLFAWVKKESPIYNYGQIISTVNDTEINIADIGITEANVSNNFLKFLLSIPGLNLVAVFYQYVLKNIFSNQSADNIHYTYRGMFCWLRFNKQLVGHTIVLPNNKSTKLDRLASFNFKEEHKISLEDPRFTDQFVVYSTDQVEARYVLSTALMERIVSLKEKFNQPILLSFFNRQMFLAVKNENGLFAFPSGHLDAINIVEEMANNIQTALQVATTLKLK